MKVTHFVDAMGGDANLWGKEKVIALLMREQRASGSIDPMLVTFSPGKLSRTLEAEGFRTVALSAAHTHGIGRAPAQLGDVLANNPADVVHSHGYRANIVARYARLRGMMRGTRLVSTCHGWVTDALNVRFYNTIDRYSSFVSDLTTVPNSRMLPRLPFARRRYIPNAVPQTESAADAVAFERPGAFVAGTLGRVCVEKGITELLAAAGDFPDRSVVFTVAGAGDLTETVRTAGDNVRYVGYFSNPAEYVAGLDVYVQASRKEGLSLSLLEAMRAGKPIVATDVGGTCDAVRDGESALIVPPEAPEALRDAVLTLRRDPELARRLGVNARKRFESEFQIRQQHERYVAAYTEVVNR